MGTEASWRARLDAATSLSSFVVHELNNALTEAAGNLELLAEDVEREALDREELRQSTRGVEHGLGGVRAVVAVLRCLYHPDPATIAVDPRLVAELAYAVAKADLHDVVVHRRYDRAVLELSPRAEAEALLGRLAKLLDEGATELELSAGPSGTDVRRVR